MMKRSEFLTSLGLALMAPRAFAATMRRKGEAMKQPKSNRSPGVQLPYLSGPQAETALRACPVMYVPIGLIEWHGRHLPLGTDALKAHAVVTACAEQFGGLVYPPVYYPYALYSEDGWNMHPDEEDWKIAMFTSLFTRIKAMGVRVIIGVSGHNVPQQITMMNRALEPVTADGSVSGVGLWEMSLSEGPESGTDHAAMWETSHMMHFHPDLVHLSELGDGPLAPDMRPPDGIGGLDPRKHASAEKGRRSMELAVEAIGRKARELLERFPEEQRTLNLPAISPAHWFSI